MKRPRYRIHAASLVYFDAVRRAGSIREAARRLNVASSAVNRQVLALEAELQMLLFERLPGGLKLTPAGEILAQHVISVLRDAEGVQSRLDALKGLEAGHVELVTLEGLCHDVVPTAIAAMSTRHPRVSIGVGILNTEDIPTAIANGDADLGLAFEVRPRPELRRIASVPFRLGVGSPSASPLATLPHASLNDLWDHPLILPKGNFANREQLHPLLFQAGLMDRGRYEAGSIDLMKQLVLKKLGVDLMTRIGLEKEIAAGLLVHAPLRHGRGYIQSSLGLRTGSRAKVEDVPRLARLMADALVLPNASGKAPFSDMALSAVMRRMNADRPEGAPPPWRDADGQEAVPHGFRASFRTWVDDTRPSDAAAAEKALAHEDESTVAARYRRSDLFDLRVPLMAAWVEWCCGQAGQKEEKRRQHRAAPQRAGSGLLNAKPKSRPKQRSERSSVPNLASSAAYAERWGYAGAFQEGSSAFRHPEGLRPLVEAQCWWARGLRYPRARSAATRPNRMAETVLHLLDSGLCHPVPLLRVVSIPASGW